MGPVSKEQVLAFREKQDREQSRFYSGPVHALTSFGIMVAVVLFCLSQLNNPNFIELSVFPVVLIVGNLFIYIFHRWVLHVPRGGILKTGYQNHTLYHHVYYTYDMIEFQRVSEIMYVLFPIRVVIAILFFIGLPLALIVAFISTANAGWLAMAGATAYFFIYELVHGMCHMPLSSRIFKLPITKWIARHHRIHHRPEICGDVNFDIIVPSFDYVFRTVKRE